MSNYRVFGPTPLIVSDNGLMTISLEIFSNAIDVSSFESTAFQAIWSGNPTGTITIQASLAVKNPDEYPIEEQAALWTDIQASVPNQPNGCPGSTYIPVYASCAKWLRLAYENTNTGQMGILTVVAFSKTR